MLNQKVKLILKTALYESDPALFYPLEYDAGYYISEREEIPVSATLLVNVKSKLKKAGLLLNYVDKVGPYQD